MALILAGLLVYSQTWSFVWDEAYWNAGWMRMFGQSWRVSHALAALLTAGAALLTGDFILTRFPVPRWRLAAGGRRLMGCVCF